MSPRDAVKVRTRSAGDVLAGLASLVALAALVAGVPCALLVLFGSPLPDQAPALDDLTRQLGPGSIITVLVTLVWLAWLQLAACVLVEVYAGVRGIGVPARVPLAGGVQSLVHRLVVAVLLLFTATTAVMPALSARDLAPARPVAAVQPEFQPVAATSPIDEETQLLAEDAAAEPVQKARTTKIYRVQPPEGRHHESLWEIADKCLGEGRRYKEIYELNKGRVQPDGSKLTIASLIRPGWILEMPADAVGARTVPVEDLDEYFRYGHPRPDPEPERPRTPEPRPSAPEEQRPDAQQPAPPRTPAPEPPKTQAPEPPKAQEPAPPKTQAPAPSEKPDQREQEQGQEPSGGAHERPDGPPPTVGLPSLPVELGWPQGLAAASLLAAGVLAALGRRRREQMEHRGFGNMIARPEGAAARVEEALRVGRDEDAARLLDLGLRQMSRSLAADGRTLPTVYGVHLGAESLDLWIAPADPNPPEPWQAHDDGQVWRLHADALPDLQAAPLSDVLAPYPGLVSIGTNPTGRILVDLEAAHGLVALRGPEPTRRAALAAIALELATNRWSDHMRITLVGFGEELGLSLAEIAPDRIRTVASLQEALPELESRSEEVRQALAASGADSVLTGRCRGVFGEAWMPHYLIMADQPTETEADRLVALARTGQRMAAGYLVAGEAQGATWTWDVTTEGRLQAGVLGFEVEAQLVPEEHYRAVAGLFRTAGRTEATPLPAPEAGGEPPMTGDHRPEVDIRLLGPIEVDAPGPMDDSRRALCTEVLVYLATHPGGVHPTVLGGAVWPRGVSAGVRDACIARVSDWLGRDSRGRPNLYYDERGRIRLGSEVRVDWAVFRWLIWRSAAEPGSEAAYMSYALDLVRGPLLADRPRGRYGWLAADPLEYEATARVIDVAHRLTVLRLEEGDPRGAVEAARTGLRLAPEDEGLWRDLLRATQATGDATQVQTAVDELRYQISRDPLIDQMQPETEALVEELVPHWHQVASR
ncbi:transcriptional activator domain-containing protein [Thermomonospora echinospora]|uniref:Transcriptional activator domain-containing protein n=1 Tax=Thermomonospora echinospora TaxID=1992 RepID=A0A1H6E1D5_9ACTN|nr:bacterial transcriptional activator domain-containing protein [Thermomonospora echinospora]SEG90735.1 transcriptional activator domain-containing protein [Thermomonospora echinospora]